MTIVANGAVVFCSKLRGADKVAVDEDDAVDVANSTDDNFSGFNAIDDDENDLPTDGMKIKMNIP